MCIATDFLDKSFKEQGTCQPLAGEHLTYKEFMSLNKNLFICKFMALYILIAMGYLTCQLLIVVSVHYSWQRVMWHTKVARMLLSYR